MSDVFEGVVEILRALVLWLLGRRERKKEHAQNVAVAEQRLDDAIDNGNTIGEISAAVEDLRKAHESS
jgi:hypothetical protein